jgi:hypothetical protein
MQLSEANTRSSAIEMTAQELAAESEAKVAALKSAQRVEIAKLERSVEESVRARQLLEERVASGESEAVMLRNALQETRRQLEVAARENSQQEKAHELRRQDFDATFERDTRRSAALERRVEALQQELLELNKTSAGGSAGGSSVIKVSHQLSWYSQQLEKSQNNTRRLQSEVERLSRENVQLNEQSSFAHEQLAQSAAVRSSSASPPSSPPTGGAGSGGGGGGGNKSSSTNLTRLSEQLSETMTEVQSSRELASARAAELQRMQCVMLRAPSSYSHTLTCPYRRYAMDCASIRSSLVDSR